MESHQALDRAIIETISEHQPAAMKQIMHQLDKAGHTKTGKNSWKVTERIYVLRKQGKLQAIGVGPHTRYALPGYEAAPPKTRQTETTAPLIKDTYLQPKVVVVETQEHDLPEGWRTLHEQQQAWEQVDQPITITPPMAQRPRLSMDISALAGDVAAQVALTVERIIGQDIKRYEAIIADLQGQLRDQANEATRLREELLAAEQLGSEAETKYNDLREKLRTL